MLTRGEIIERSVYLRKRGVRTGQHRTYWLSYQAEEGQTVRECYLRVTDRDRRALEVAKRRGVER